jgi:hypothetical protein
MNNKNESNDNLVFGIGISGIAFTVAFGCFLFNEFFLFFSLLIYGIINFFTFVTVVKILHINDKDIIGFCLFFPLMSLMFIAQGIHLYLKYGFFESMMFFSFLIIVIVIAFIVKAIMNLNKNKKRNLQCTQQKRKL